MKLLCKQKFSSILLACTILSPILLQTVSFNDETVMFSLSQQLPVDRVRQQATAITVKILAKGALGSGTIVHQMGETYTVLTNQHVLQAGIAPYFVQTSDGITHAARVISVPELKKYDLAMLQFKVTVPRYAVAQFGVSKFLQIGEEVFAAGYPVLLQSSSRQASVAATRNRLSKEFLLHPGRLSLTLDKALEDGYQVGFTNELERGMSGGPLLNLYGEVVGINGLSSNSLWEASDLYADGSMPCSSLQKLIADSSWAIPIETVSRLIPRFLQPRDSRLQFSSLFKTPLNSSDIDSDFKAYVPFIIRRMQANAFIAKGCGEIQK